MRRQLIIFVALALVSLASFGAPASAGHGNGTPEVTPTIISGNPNCSGFGLGATEFKVEPVQDGTFSTTIAGLGFVSVTLDVNEGAKSFAFDLSDNVVALVVLVKGGPAANAYDYRPNGINHDDGLIAPNNLGLSHISFCLAEAPKFGAIEITKTAKDPVDGQQPLAGAQFTINPGAHTVTTDASGKACVADLAFGTYTVTETTAPSGYAKADPDSQQVTVDQEGTCTLNPETVNFENTPLTDLFVKVEAQVDGATRSTIECDGSSSGAESDPAELSVTDLEPGTYTCTIVIDP
ncbi:MAG: prealbumin-like fold domain-containing protein [Actinomycetota bacterium]